MYLDACGSLVSCCVLVGFSMGVIYWLDVVYFDVRRIKSFLWGTKHIGW